MENYDYLRNIRIPDGIFFSSKGMVRKSDRLLSGDEDDDYHSGGSSMHDGVSYGPSSPVMQHFATPEHLEHRHRSNSQHSSYPYDPRYPMPSNVHPHALHNAAASQRPSGHRTFSHDSGTLPRLSTIAPLPPSAQYPSPTSPIPHGHTPSSRFSSSQLPSPQSYLPLSPEDRRALNTFKVVL